MRHSLHKKIAIVLIFAMTFTSLSSFSSIAYAAQPDKKAQEQMLREAKEGEILVKYKNNSQSDTVKTKVKSKLSLSKMEEQFEDKELKMEVISVNDKDVTKTIAELKKNPNVVYAQPNYKLTVYGEPDYYKQWGLNNTGQTVDGVAGSTEASIQVEPVWNVSKGEPDVIVGVLDTGVDIGHPELSSHIFTNEYEIPGNGIDDDGNGYIDDVNGWDFYNNDNTLYDEYSTDSHGTMVSGIIAANENNIGIIGISPNVTLLPLKFIGPSGGYTSDAIKAIEYAKRMGVSVMNCSFGGPDDNRALKEAMAASDILFICAAGNSGANVQSQPVYPACFGLSNIIPVTSVNNTGNLAAGANYGLSLIAAPGKNIWTTMPGNTYGYGSGSSFAAAFVTGAVALIKSIFKDLTNLQIKEKIINGLSHLDVLKDKVMGLLSVNGAMYGTSQPGTTDSAITTPGAVTGSSLVTALSASISQSLIDAIHFGEAGVNYATGNYSKTITPISLQSPGFLVNMSFTYNSKDTRATSLMGRGWTFGFEGSLKQDTGDTALYIAKLPDGSAQTFRKSGSTYTAEDSRSKLEAQSDGTLLTTKDQYKYSFNSAGYLQWMEDKNGNRVTIAVEGAGKVKSITDAVGRTFTVNYDGSGRISSISAPGGLTIQMTYNSAGLLSTLKDPEGNFYSFEYDSSNFLTKYKDRECQAGGSFGSEYTEQMTYDHTSGVDRVTSYTDSFNNTQAISYDTTNNVTTITDSNQRVVKKSYDTKGYIIKTVDPLNLTTTVTYNLTGGNNLYGEEATITDRNGNTTTYTRDERGNIKKIDYPDGSASSYEYDSKNNLTKEVDQEGKKHFYNYDGNGNLIEEAIPINGTSDYTSGASQDQFVVKKYAYSNFGNAKGLLQSSTDGNGNTTTFDYDAHGYMKSQTDVNKHVTAYTYSITGNLLKQVDPDGMVTTFAYDKNGNLLRKSISGKYTTRYFYDKEERPVREISPNEYRADLDGLLFSTPVNTYNNPYVGKFTSYYKSGSVKIVKDNAGYVTSFQYDSYGNKKVETRPNDAQYVYGYDGINRITRTDFKQTSTAPAIQLDGYEYIPGANCNTKYTKYLAASETAITTTYYDKLDREITITSPEGHTKTITYYKNGEVQSESDYNGHATYYKYDGLNRKTFTYDPVEEGQYSCTQTVYDKNDNVLEDRVSRNLVALDSLPSESEFLKRTVNIYDNENNVIKTLTPVGGETAFEYNNTNDCIKTSVLKNALLEREEKTFAYNDLGLVIKETTIVRAKDIYGNNEKASGNYDVVKLNTYDPNGNLIKIVRPNKYQVNNTYDANNRLIMTREDAMDENGALVTKTTRATYDYDGNVLSTTDALGHITKNEYDKRGNLIKKYTLVTSEGNTVPIAALYAYDNAGRLIKEVSPKNFVSGADIDSLNRTEYVYDKEDRPLQAKSIYKKPGSDAFTTVVTKAMTYDNNGNVLTEKDAMGVHNNYATVNTYNYNDQLVKTLKPADADKERPFSQKLVYDGLGRVVSEIDGRGVIKNTYYNDASEVTKEGLKLNDGAEERIIAKYEYDFAGNQISKTDGNGNKTTYEYTHTNQISSVTTPSDETIAQMTTTYQYDPEDKLKKKKTSAGLVQVMSYDPQGNLLSTNEADNTNDDGILTQTRYDLNGNARYMIDGNNNVTSLYYDEANRLIKKSITTKSARNVSTVHAEQSVYDASGNVVKTIDWLGNATKSEYDALGRLIKKTGADGIVLEDLEYNDNNAQVKSVTYMDKQPLTMIFEYDKNNRLTKKINNGIAIEAVTYDGSGNIETKTDGNSNTYSFYYDEANKLIRVVNPLSAQTVYTYDPAGNLIGQKNENGDETLFEYNCLNLPKKKIDAGGRSGLLGVYTYDLKKVEAYTYYPNGLMKEKVDRNGIHTTYQYDVHGRLLVTKAGNMSVVNTYDKNGNKVSMTDATGSTGRVYDAMNRCIVKTVPNIGATIFDYDIMTPLGACKEVTTDPKGNVSSKVYDKLGRIIAVENAGAVKANYSYYENGLKKSVSYSQNDVTESYTYFPNGQLKQLTNAKGGAVLYNYTYEYDKAGNQTQKVETKAGGQGLATAYQYDRLNHLLKVTEPGSVVTEYTYDPAGNRLTEAKTSGGKTKLLTYTYNEQNRLISTKEDIGTTKENVEYIYDNNGNLLYSKKEQLTLITDPKNIPDASFSMLIMGQTTKEENPFVSWISSYQYDEFNQMIKSTTADGVIENKYNGEGLRTEKTLGGELTRYLYIEDQPVLEVDQYGRETARNIVGTNMVSRIVDKTSEMYYLYNGHGDVTELVTPQGDISAEYTYDAFGVPKTTTGKADNPFRYAGYQYDESGLYYLNSRMYNPVIARFMQEDTYRGNISDPLSLNLYAYCNNNPLIYTDPDGHSFKSALKKVVKTVKKVVKNIGSSGSSTAAAYRSTANNLNSSSVSSNHSTPTTNTPPKNQPPSPTTTTKKSTNVVNTNTGTQVKVTLPNYLGGGTVAGIIKNGRTTITGYGKLPEGTIVHSYGGDYWIHNGASERYPSSSSTSSNKNSTSSNINKSASNSNGANKDNLSKTKLFEKNPYYKSSPEYTKKVVKEQTATFASGLITYVFGGAVLRTAESVFGRAASETAGTEARAALTAAEIDGTAGAEIYYRTMSRADYNSLLKNGKIPATGETFISPTQSFSDGYNGVTVEFKVKVGTTDKLVNAGVRDFSTITQKNYSNMPSVETVDKWTLTNTYFKGEGNQINIGLGKGLGLDIFNNNIVDFRVVEK